MVDKHEYFGHKVGSLVHNSGTYVLKYKILSYNESQRDALFLKFILIKNCTCFGQICCPSSGVLTLYMQQQVFVMLVTLTVC